MAIKLSKTSLLLVFAAMMVYGYFFSNTTGYIVGYAPGVTEVTAICPNKPYSYQVGLLKTDVQKSSSCWDGNLLLSKYINVTGRIGLAAGDEALSSYATKYYYVNYKCHCMEGCELPKVNVSYPADGNWLMTFKAFDAKGTELAANALKVGVTYRSACDDMGAGAEPEQIPCYVNCTGSGDQKAVPVSNYTLCSESGCVSTNDKDTFDEWVSESTKQISAIIPNTSGGSSSQDGGSQQGSNLFLYVGIAVILVGAYLVTQRR